jgi:hypothetical protein
MVENYGEDRTRFAATSMSTSGMIIPPQFVLPLQSKNANGWSFKEYGGRLPRRGRVKTASSCGVRGKRSASPLASARVPTKNSDSESMAGLLAVLKRLDEHRPIEFRCALLREPLALALHVKSHARAAQVHGVLVSLDGKHLIVGVAFARLR